VVLSLICLAGIVFFGFSERVRPQAANDLPPYRNPQLPVEQRVADLLSRMTLEEKVAQTLCPFQIEVALRDEQGNFSEAKARELLKNGMGQILEAIWLC
jgi:beta-glucosidase